MSEHVGPKRAEAFLRALTRLSRKHGVVLVDTYGASSVDGLKLFRITRSDRLKEYVMEPRFGIIGADLYTTPRGQGKRKL